MMGVTTDEVQSLVGRKMAGRRQGVRGNIKLLASTTGSYLGGGASSEVTRWH